LAAVRHTNRRTAVQTALEIPRLTVSDTALGTKDEGLPETTSETVLLSPVYCVLSTVLLAVPQTGV